MSMYIPTGEINTTGLKLSDIASKMQKLSTRASSINSSISHCYMQGGVGWRAGNAATQMQSIANHAQTKGENLCTAASIYEKKEADLYSRSCAVASNIQSGYNVSWVNQPGMQCVLSTGAVATGAVAGESALKKYIGNDLKTSGSVKSWDTKAGSVDVLYGKAGIENSANWDIKKGNVGVGVKASASGSALHIENEGRVGIVKGGYEASVGTVKAEGKATLNVYSSGEFNPKLEASAKAEAQGVSGKLEGSLGTDDLNVHLKGEGTVGKAEAEAKIAISKDGVGGKAEAGAAVFSGKATVGFKILGLKIDASIKGEALSVGAGAEFGVSDSSFEVGGKLSFLAGLGLKIKVSW